MEAVGVRMAASMRLQNDHPVGDDIQDARHLAQKAIGTAAGWCMLLVKYTRDRLASCPCRMPAPAWGQTFIGKLGGRSDWFRCQHEIRVRLKLMSALDSRH